MAAGILLSLRSDQHPNFLSLYSTFSHRTVGDPGGAVVVTVVIEVGGVVGHNSTGGG